MCSDGILESNNELTNKEIWVKELLENIETNDIQRIADILLQESIDNGLGIAKDDMEIAFERHATSKIRSADDLSTVIINSNDFKITNNKAVDSINTNLNKTLYC